MTNDVNVIGPKSKEAGEVMGHYRDTAFNLKAAANAYATQAPHAVEFGFHPASIYVY